MTTTPAAPLGGQLDLLRCPVCTSAFIAEPGSVVCVEGHRFDLARQGYLNLLQGPAPRHADTAAMVAARVRVQASDTLDGVAGTVRTSATGLAPAGRTPVVLEVGAGTGYYTAAAVEASGGRGLALDISVPACRRAARAHPRVGAVVADTWGRLPIADGVVDLVLCVFAPRHAAEFARVLRPDGSLLVVTPGANHLRDLRTALGLLAVDPDKRERLSASLVEYFGYHYDWGLSYPADLSRAEVADVVAMGPNAFHDSAERDARLGALPEPYRAVIAVELSRWRPIH